MIRNLLCFFIIYALFSFPIKAQNEANIWYFGKYAGIDFNGGTPVSINGGQVSSYGGPASICDANGNLLFYTDGMEIWDRNHNLMPNGSGLTGNKESTQASIIVQQPGNSNIYYVFSNDAYFSNNGVHYSIVDMSLNGGFGDVTATKNVLLQSSSTEKISAVQHANEVDYWIICHERNNDVFNSYKLSSLGLGNAIPSAVGISHTGSVSASDVFVGQMKTSPDGSRLAVATSAFSNTFQLFDFDPATGLISNPITLQSSTFQYPYGIEFSPDGTRFYIGTYNGNNKIYQLNLQAGSAAAILNSSVLVGESFSGNIGALQTGPDSKIYVARYNATYLGVISQPNALGTACNYIDNGISLGSNKCRKGLPCFVQSYFNHPRFLYEGVCYGDSTFFAINDVTGVLSVLWNFGDPASGTANTSMQLQPFHIFSSPGTYNVTLIRNFDTSSDTVFQPVVILASPELNLGNDTSLCPGEDITIQLTGDYSQIAWYNGTSSPNFYINSAGSYWVEVSDSNHCKSIDTISVEYLELPVVNLGADTILCESQGAVLDAGNPGAEYLWSIGLTTPTITVTDNGIYSVTVSNRCGSDSDHVEVTVIPAIYIDLGEDQTICMGDTVVLQAEQFDDTEYLWSTGSSNLSIEILTTGTYYITLSDQCMTITDSAMVNVIDTPLLEVSPDTFLCEGEAVFINATASGYDNIIWSNGIAAEMISVSETGDYSVIASNACFSVSDTVSVDFIPSPSDPIRSDTTIYDDESLELNINYNNYYTYLWNPSTFLDDQTDGNPVSTPTSSVNYTVEITDTNGCKNTYSVSINVLERPLPEIEVFNTFTPNDDGRNDYWVILNIESYENSLLEIYNRDGRLIRSWTNYMNDWDGTFKGKDVPAATYYYILNLGVPEKEILRGTVTIIR